MNLNNYGDPAYLYPKHRALFGPLAKQKAGRGMTPKSARSLEWLAAVLATLVLIGCGDTAGRAKMEVRELGLSMDLSPGWEVDANNPRMFAKGDGTGLVLDEPLGGRTFEQCVEALSQVGSPMIKSRTPLTIGGCQAVEMVDEYPAQGSKAIKVYLHKNDRVVEISIVTSNEEFRQHESALRKAIQSVRFKS